MNGKCQEHACFLSKCHGLTVGFVWALFAGYETLSAPHFHSFHAYDRRIYRLRFRLSSRRTF